MLLQVLDGSQFYRILLGVVRFNELIFDDHIPLDLEDFFTTFLPGIISSQGNRTTLFSDEITVDVRELFLGSHAIDIDDMGF